MGGISLVTAMDGLAAAFLDVTGVDRSFGYPNEDAIVGDALVGYPETIDFDLTFGRGADRATFPVWVICGLVNDATTRAYASDLILGVADVKDQVDGSSTIAGATARVSDCLIERVVLRELMHLSVRFNVDVIL